MRLPIKLGAALAAALWASVLCAESQSETDLEVARRALRDGIWNVALSRADSAFANTSDENIRNEARFIALEAMAGESRFKEALDRIERAQLTSNEPEGDAMRYWHSWMLMKLDRGQEAKSVLAKPFVDGAWRGKGELLAAKVLYTVGDYAEAAARLAPFLKERGETTDKARLLMGEISAARGRIDEAKSSWSAIVSLGEAVDSTVFAEASRRLGECLWKEGRTNDTIAVLSAGFARAGTPELKRALKSELGFSEMAVPQMRSKGLGRIRDLITESPDTKEARDAQLRLADTLLDQGDAEGAQMEYQRYLEAYPDAGDDASALEGRAWALQGLGRNSEAAGVFALAVRHYQSASDKARCLYKQGDALKAESRLEEAARRYTEASLADPKEFGSRGLFAAADMIAKEGREDEAMMIWTELSKRPDIWAYESAINMAARAAKDNRTEEALKTYESVIMSTNADERVKLRARAGRGRTLYNAYRFDEAAAEFRIIEATDPKRAETMRFMRALCRFGEGRDDEARSEVQAISSSTKDPVLKEHSVMWLARMDYNAGEWQGAERRFTELAKMAREVEFKADAYVWAARSAFQRNEFSKAVELVAEAIKVAPESPAIKRGLLVQSEALMELARYDDAVLVLDRAIANEQEPDALRHLTVLKADALFAMGADNAQRWEEALAQYRTALGQGVPSPSEKLEIAFKIGRSLDKLRRAADAAEQYYVNVVMAYYDARKAGVWFDASARMAFSRAAFALADRYEGLGEDSQAVQILRIVVRSGVGARDEAQRRIDAIRSKGRIL